MLLAIVSYKYYKGLKVAFSFKNGASSTALYYSQETLLYIFLKTLIIAIIWGISFSRAKAGPMIDHLFSQDFFVVDIYFCCFQLSRS